jgi:transposase InsO family protein
VRYAFIERHKNVWPVADQCRVLEVAASGFRAWRRRQAAERRAAPGERVPDLALLTHIRAEFAASKQTYGWPRMVRQLRAEGLRVGKERVRKMMNKHDIRVRSRRRFKVTTNSNHDLPIAPNLLNREFSTEAPNKAWVGDITYVWTAEGWLYLATVIDLFSRQVVGFSMGERMGAQLVVDALRMAWFRRKPAPGLIFHSDRGSQYASTAFVRQLNAFAIRASMSRKGDCWDNAVAESLFGSLKTESLQRHDFGTRRAASDEIMAWTTRYNHTRLHSTLGYLSPMAYEKNWLARNLAQAA